MASIALVELFVLHIKYVKVLFVKLFFKCTKTSILNAHMWLETLCGLRGTKKNVSFASFNLQFYHFLQTNRVT